MKRTKRSAQRRTKRSAQRRAHRRTRRRTHRTRTRQRGGMSEPTIFNTYAGLPEAKERPTIVFSKLDPRDQYAPRTAMTLQEAEHEAINATIPE